MKNEEVPGKYRLRMILYWTAALIPLLWGVVMTVIKAAALLG